MKTTLFLAVVCTASPVLAAEHSQPQPLHRPPFWYHHASTALEGALRGLAEYVSAWGEFYVNRANAEHVAQQARQLAIEAEQQRIHAYWRIKNEYAQRTYGSSITPETLEKINAARRPKRLPPHVTAGREFALHWPAVLRAKSFDRHRVSLEKALGRRARGNYGPASDAYSQGLAARDAMLDVLQTRIRDMTPMEYIAAKRFIQSAGYELMFSPSEQMVANETDDGQAEEACQDDG